MSQLRDFLHVVEREGAALGLFITLDPVTSRAARAEVAGAGSVMFGTSTYPKVQLWSVSQWFAGERPDLPALADPYTGKPMVGSLGVKM